MATVLYGVWPLLARRGSGMRIASLVVLAVLVVSACRASPVTGSDAGTTVDAASPLDQQRTDGPTVDGSLASPDGLDAASDASDSGGADANSDAVTSVDTVSGSDGPSSSATWAVGFGGVGIDESTAVAIDSQGNVYVLGTFKGTADFGGGPLASNGKEDVFLASYTASGVHRFVRRYGGYGADFSGALAIDGSDNLYISGSVGLGPIDFGGGGSLATSGFILSVTSSGGYRWLRPLGSSTASGLATDGAGRVWAVGGMFVSGDVGGGPLPAAWPGDVLVARFDAASGGHQFSTVYGGSGRDSATALAIDDADNVYLVGTHEGGVDFGDGAIATQGLADCFVASLTSKAALRWAKGFGAAATDVCTSVAVDSAGHVTLTGRFNGTIDVGGGSLASAGGTDVVLAQLDAAGAHQWSKRFGAAFVDKGAGVTVDAVGDIFVVGSFGGVVDFGGGALDAAGGASLFVASFAADGAHRWSTAFGGAPAAIAARGGRLAFAGYYGGSVDFGGGPITATSAQADAFVAGMPAPAVP